MMPITTSTLLHVASTAEASIGGLLSAYRPGAKRPHCGHCSKRLKDNRARAEERSRLFEQACEKLNLPVAPRALDSLTYKDFAECACADKLARWRIGTS